MMDRRFLAAVLAVLVIASYASAQKNHELTGVIGATVISNQGVPGTNFFDNVVHFGRGFTFEVNYGRRLTRGNLTGLTLEVPVVFDFDEDLNYGINAVPEGYSSYFITPSVRANLFPRSGLSPWISFGGGLGHFSESSNLLFFGTNPGPRGTTTGVLQGGLGLEVRVWKRFSVRGGVRDFYSGVPQLNLDTGKNRQHNFFVGSGVVWHF